MVNGNGAIFIQRNGKRSAVDAALDPKYLANAVKRIARSLGNDIGESKPLLDTRLPDGSRVAAAFPPCSLHGVTLTIRKFRPHWFTMGDHRNGRNGPVPIDAKPGAPWKFENRRRVGPCAHQGKPSSDIARYRAGRLHPIALLPILPILLLTSSLCTFDVLCLDRRMRLDERAMGVLRLAYKLLVNDTAKLPHC